MNQTRGGFLQRFDKETPPKRFCDIIKVFYLPTDAQMNCLKNSIKIYIKTAPTCFGAVTPSSGSSLFVLAKVTVVKIDRCG